MSIAVINIKTNKTCQYHPKTDAKSIPETL